MLRQTFQRMTRSRQKIYRNIFKICSDIKFKSRHRKARRLCHDIEVLCGNNYNKMLRGNSITTKEFIVVTKVEKNYRKNVVTHEFMS